MSSAGIKRSPSPHDLRANVTDPQNDHSSTVILDEQLTEPTAMQGVEFQDSSVNQNHHNSSSSLPLSEQSTRGQPSPAFARDSQHETSVASGRDRERYKSEDVPQNTLLLDQGRAENPPKLAKSETAPALLDLWPKTVRRGGNPKVLPMHSSSQRADRNVDESSHDLQKAREQHNKYITRCKYLKTKVDEGEKALGTLANEILRLRRTISEREKLLEIDRKLLENQEQCAEALQRKIKDEMQG